MERMFIARGPHYASLNSLRKTPAAAKAGLILRQYGAAGAAPFSKQNQIRFLHKCLAASFKTQQPCHSRVWLGTEPSDPVSLPCDFVPRVAPATPVRALLPAQRRRCVSGSAARRVLWMWGYVRFTAARRMAFSSKYGRAVRCVDDQLMRSALMRSTGLGRPSFTL